MTTLAVLWRGLLMGLAEVVPGVSGGTIAFVTGIYPKLVESLARFGVGSFSTLHNWRTFFVYHNLSFLIPLGLGMALGIAMFAKLMTWLLAHYQPSVWAFFSGLILMSVLVVEAASSCGVSKVWSSRSYCWPGIIIATRHVH